jgi:peptidoglycan/LPS O-acetylase OafA/YrhL
MIPPPREELTALTSLRGMAAVLVMFHHFMNVLLKDTMAIEPTNLIYKSYLWVDLFFILSGFVLAYVYHSQFLEDVRGRSYWRFMQARFARIYPLHFFMLSVFLGYEGLQWLLSQRNAAGMVYLSEPFTAGQSTSSLLSNLLLVQTLHWRAYWNEPAWSISAEWLIYFTLPFVMFALVRLRARWFGVVAFAALIPLMLIEWHFGDLGLYFAGWPMLFRCLCEAILGVLAFRCYQLGLLQNFASARLVMPVLLLNLLILAVPGPGVPSVMGFVWLVLCAARLPPHQPHPLNSPLPVYLGKISYSVYLLHWLFLDLVRDGFLFFTGLPVHQALTAGAQIGLLVILSVLVIGVSELTYRWIEAPMRSRLKPRASRTINA